jgi:hypothetical protein
MNQPLQRPNSLQHGARRRFLISSLLGLLASGVLGSCTKPHRTRDISGDSLWWLDVAGERAAATRLGHAYLRSHPEERDLGLILGAIEAAIATVGHLEPTALQRAIRMDYQRATVVSVHRWLLSRTEARVYAAIALYTTGTAN